MKLANRQVRLDPDVCGWIESCAYDYDISLSATVNKLLRTLRDEPPQPVRAVQASTSTARQAPRVPLVRAAPVRSNVSPRAVAILRQNAAQ